MVLTQDCRGAK